MFVFRTATLSFLRHLLTPKPLFLEPTHDLIRLLIDRGRFDEAVAALEPAIAPAADRPGPNRAAELSYFASELTQHGVKAAVPLLQSLAAQEPDDPVVNYRLGEALVAFGDPAAAAPHFQRAAAAQPADGDKWQWLYKAMALSRVERPAEAEASFRQLLMLEPHFLDARHHLIRLLIDRGRFDEAVAALEPAIAAAADRPGPNRAAEFAYFASELTQHGVKAAVPLLQSLAAQVPDDPVVNYRLGEALVAFGDPAAAAPHFQRAAAAQPADGDKWQWLYKAMALSRVEQPAEAEASFRQLLMLEPHFLDAKHHLIRLLIDRGRFDEAVAALEPAIARAADRPGPNRAAEFAYFASELTQHGVKAAVPLLQSLAAQVPDDPVVNCRLGEALVAFGDPAAAAPHFQRAAAAQPADGDKWQRLYTAIALSRVERRAEAEASFRHLLTFEPKNVDATYHLVRLLIDQGRFAEAFTTLDAAVGALRERSAPLANLALELTVRGVKRADGVLQCIVELISGDPKALRDLAQAAFWYGAGDHALDYISRLRAITDSVALQIDDALMLPYVMSNGDDIDYWVDRFQANVAALTSSGLRISNPLETIIKPPHFQLFCYGINTRKPYRDAATAWQTLCPDLLWTAPHCETWAKSPPRPRLRVGFLTQPTFPLVWGIAKELDRARFEVVHLHEQSDLLTPTSPWQGAADRHVVIPNRELEKARRAIADQALDILIHMPFTPVRYFLSHARLAPVQCVLCEPCYTDGLANLDYYISWAPAEPKAPDRWYNCAVALMNRAPYWVERDYTKPAALLREHFDLPQSSRWYICATTPIKMHPKFDAVLAKILVEDPEAILVLLRGSWLPARVVEQRIRAAVGCAADRVHVLPSLAIEHAHALLELADAVLDAWPLGGMSSSFAAIHAGIPTVTLPTDVPFGRWLASMYEAIGVIDLVAQDEADFVRLAIRLANEPRWRTDIATRIKERNAGFIEDRLAVRELEAFLMEAVSRAHNGQQPRSWKEGRFREMA